MSKSHLPEQGEAALTAGIISQSSPAKLKRVAAALLTALVAVAGLATQPSAAHAGGWKPWPSFEKVDLGTEDTNGNNVVGDPGDTIYYAFEWTVPSHTSPYSAMDATLSDPLLGIEDHVCAQKSVPTATGATYTCGPTPAKHVITEDDAAAGEVVNCAVFSHSNLIMEGLPDRELESCVTTETAPSPPVSSIDLRKNAEGDDSLTVAPGVHEIEAVFTNGGEEALQGLVFTDITELGQDAVWGADDLALLDGLVLEPGASVTIRGTVEIAPGETHRDIAKIAGVGVTSGVTVEDEDPATLVSEIVDHDQKPDVPAPEDPSVDNQKPAVPAPEAPSTDNKPAGAKLAHTGSETPAAGIAMGALMLAAIGAVLISRKRVRAAK